MTAARHLGGKLGVVHSSLQEVRGAVRAQSAMERNG